MSPKKSPEPRLRKSNGTTRSGGLRKDANRIIDQDAQKIFRGLLPGASWEVYELSPDIGKDYQVELVEKGQYLGTSFVVQLKGQSKVAKTADKTGVRFKLETKYLRYYETLRLPVFLVLVDVTKRRAYWLFVQQYIRDALDAVDWRNLTAKWIGVPTANSFADLVAFRKAVVAADAYMGTLQPNAISEAIAAEARRLEAIDPRFKVTMTATDTSKNYTLTPKEAVEFQLRIRGQSPAIDEKMKELIDRGQPITLDDGDIEVVGSPLLARTMKGSTTLRAGLSSTGVLGLRRLSHDGRSTLMFSLPMDIEGGRKELRIRAQRGVFSVEVTATSEGRVKLSINIDLTSWKSSPLISLPMFREVDLWATAVSSDSRVSIESVVAKLPPLVFESSATELRTNESETMLEFIRFVSVARRIAEYCKSGAVLPDSIRERDILGVNRLSMLIDQGEYSESCPSFAVEVGMPECDLARITLDGSIDGVCSPIRRTSNTYEFEFFDGTVFLGPIEIILTRGRIAEVCPPIDGEGLSDVRIVGTAESRITVRYNSEASRTTSWLAT